MTETDIAPLAAGEAVESAFLRAMAQGAADDAELRTLTVGIAAAMAMRSESPMVNRAIGFSEPVDADLLAPFVGMFREAGTARAGFKLPRPVLPADWAEVCARLGLLPAPQTLKLTRSAARPAEPVTTDLRIAPVEADAHERALKVLLTGFGDLRPPAEVIDMISTLNRHPRSRQFAAWDGDEIVAVGLVFADRDAAVLKGGVTLPSHRGRGAQSALIAARIEAAREAGCRWVVSETSQPAAGEHHTSLSNLERAGFVRVYDYVNVLLT
ncbi:GNAT family N-acetyltransferase [Catenuloplanes japonicus]|uniref:GNAT family N-acetyltransferase n=1 Tax=Catenuloplanes japonicus TaxID=33876 RepID=UPI00068DD639|nr:GNAT family N-acetyltransferase [Catenuloplanes japonicus]